MKELSMKERRLYKRHTARLPSRIEAIIPGGTKKIYDFETKDISIGGAFLYTNESLSFPQETRFIMDITIPKGSTKEFMDVKSLMECTGTVVRSSSEGIAIQCSDECEIMNIRGS
jgi:c-di-GMP-binding flagellar brake protein YcgR